MFAQGKQAFINLTTREIQYSEIPEVLIKNFLGGRGINVFQLYKYLKPGIDPLSPDNILIFGLGLLTGTLAPSSSRINISAKSPESLILGDANIGGHLGAGIRMAGFSRLLFLGKAEKPTIAHLHNGKVELADANDIWGLNIPEAIEGLKEKFGEDIRFALIGRAGEKLVRMAGIMGGRKAIAARGGLGAVMGSKNLKAIVAQGRSNIDYYDPQGLENLRKELNKYISGSRVIEVLGKYGTPFLFRPSNMLGAIRTKNSTETRFAETLYEEEIAKFISRRTSCFNCIVHCRAHNVLGGEGPEYSSIGALGANCGISSPEEVIKLANLCNELGLDTTSVGTIIAWAIELYEKGIIDKAMTGRPLHFGDFETVRQLILDISERRGFGNILAESTQAVRYFPPQAKDYLIAVKGLPQSDPHDVRIIKAFALGIAVASRGADHLRNRPTLEIFQKISDEVMERIYGERIVRDITAYETKEIPVIFSEDLFAVNDSLGICRFVCHGFNSPHLLGYEEYVRMIEKVTGLKFSAVELREIGKRIIDLERMFNIREGLRRKDDTLPRRYFEEPIKVGQHAGEKIDRVKFEALLTQYYKRRGWDQNGTPLLQRYEEINQLIYGT